MICRFTTRLLSCSIQNFAASVAAAAWAGH